MTEQIVIKIGFDLGNYDGKTQSTTTPSSFRKYNTENKLATEILIFNNDYYMPTEERDNQEKDKTKNDYALIMTLFGMAKEIIAQTVTGPISPAELQKKVSAVKSVKLGLGLPVGYFSELSKSTLAYYEKCFANGVSFAYKGPVTQGENIYFNFEVDNVAIFPQDVIAVARNPKLFIPREYDDYYIFGMGGGTVDIIPIRNKVPQVEDCVTLPLGTTEMYKFISKYLQQNGSDEKDYQIIEKVITGKNTILPENEKKMITECVSIYADKLIQNFIHRGLKLKDYPSVFIGGGGLLLKPYIEKNKAFARVEFVENVHENAIYFAKAL